MIDTEHCSFVFQEDCRPDAERLAATADDVYAQIVAYLGVDPGVHVRVVITGDSQMLNGSTLPIPVDEIVISRAPGLDTVAAEPASACFPPRVDSRDFHQCQIRFLGLL